MLQRLWFRSSVGNPNTPGGAAADKIAEKVAEIEDDEAPEEAVEDPADAVESGTESSPKSAGSFEVWDVPRKSPESGGHSVKFEDFFPSMESVYGFEFRPISRGDMELYQRFAAMSVVPRSFLFLFFLLGVR